MAFQIKKSKCDLLVISLSFDLRQFDAVNEAREAASIRICGFRLSPTKVLFPAIELCPITNCARAETNQTDRESCALSARLEKTGLVCHCSDNGT